MTPDEIDKAIDGAVSSVEFDFDDHWGFDQYGRDTSGHRPAYDAHIAELRWIGERLKHLEAENAALRTALGECSTDIAQAMLESGFPLDLLPVEDARLTLASIAKRIEKVSDATS